MSFLIYALGALLLFSSVVMILLVLIQRGRGGGLAGAFGGMGGQSDLGDLCWRAGHYDANDSGREREGHRSGIAGR